MDRQRRGALWVTAAALAGLLSAPAVRAHGEGQPYYDSILDGREVAELADPASGYPTSLHIRDSDSVARYRLMRRRLTGSEWSLLLDPVELTHELVEASQHVLLVLPLPADADGRPRFESAEWGIRPWGRSATGNVPMVLNRNRIILKRNVVLEAMLLPGLVGDASAADKLPDLAGTRYAYTLWEAIVANDPALPPEPVCWATFRYVAGPFAPGPDPSDPDLHAYVITWIPELGAGVPPVALRVDIREPEE